MTEKTTDSHGIGQRGATADENEPCLIKSLAEQSNETDLDRGEASLLLSRRGAFASLLGMAGLNFLSNRATATTGSFRGLNSTGTFVNAQFSPTITFASPGPSENPSFGSAVALDTDGATALIGAPYSSTDGGPEVGEAYVFTRTAAGWDLANPVTLPNPDPDDRDYFGRETALSADGTTALISAPGDASGTGLFDLSAGEAYLFRQDGADWNTDHPVTFSNPDPEYLDSFGLSVALSADGQTVLIGVPRKDAGADYAGIAYLYMRIDGSWNTSDPVVISNPDPDPYDSFGTAVALSADGSTALVSEYEYGTAYLFRRTEEGWDTADPTILPTPSPDVSGAFGTAVALSADGRTALVGAPNSFSPDVGTAYIFTRTETGWDTTDPVTIPNPDPDLTDNFGGTVALSADGNTALISTQLNPSDYGNNSGETYVFRRTTEGWNTADPSILSNPDPLGEGAEYEDDYFGLGAALSADGEFALIGSPGPDTDTAFGPGQAHLFERTHGQPPLVFDDQTTSGETVTISSVRMPDGGFVVIASADGDTIYGVSEYLTPGTTTSLQITLTTPLPESGTYLASGQADTNDNRRFDAPRVLDVCQLDANEIPLLDTAEITIQ